MTRPVIWINITTSYHWQRAAVGIVRVESELARYLPDQYLNSQVAYCIWQHDKFVKVDNRRNACPGVKTVPPASPPKAEIYLSKLSKRQAVKQIVLSFMALLPVSWQPKIRQILLRLNHCRHQCLQRWRNRNISNQQSAPPLIVPQEKRPASTIFQTGDVLLTVGLDWNYPYRPELRRLKKYHGIRIVSCCYDLIPVLYPQYCVGDVAATFSEYFLDVARLSDLILCISIQTQQDLIKHLHDAGAPVPPTQVFRLGDNIVSAITEQSLDPEVAALIHKPFILFVSTIERRKNHQVLYQAYHQLAASGYKAELPQMIWVGMPGWGTAELLEDIRLDPLIQGKITICHHVSDASLAALYQHALLTVFPSHYEGWGLPVAESLAYGTPVLSSDKGSLPEVGGQWVQYCDPLSPHDWANAILHWSRNPDALQVWRQRLAKDYQPQLWADSAKIIANALRKMLAAPAEKQVLNAGYDTEILAGYQAGPVIVSGQPASPLCRSYPLRLNAGHYQLQLTGQISVDQRCTVTIQQDGQQSEESNLQWPAGSNALSLFFHVPETAMISVVFGHDAPDMRLHQLVMQPVNN